MPLIVTCPAKSFRTQHLGSFIEQVVKPFRKALDAEEADRHGVNNVERCGAELGANEPKFNEPSALNLEYRES